MDQETREYCAQLVREIIDGVDAGDFAQEIIPDKYRWEHLLGLWILKDELDGGEDLFREIHGVASRSAERYLKSKAVRGERIQVAFQSYSAAQWPAENVYRRFEEEKNVDVKVIASPLVDRDAESTVDTYRQTRDWYRGHGYNLVEGLNLETGDIANWNDLGGYPDVLYQLSSWFTCLPQVQWFTKLPMRCIVAYIPYGITQADSGDGSYAKDNIFNKDIVNLIWRVYCDSKYVLRGYQEHQLLRGANAKYCGYAKMDYFYETHAFDDVRLRELWHIPSGSEPKSVKKVIIAPHYTVFHKSAICYSTFHKNMWFWLYLAHKYENEIAFVFKPHPNLRRSSVSAGLFQSYEDYDSYIHLWNSCPNAVAVQEGNYLEYFETSDAMIMDSGSFLGEYLYTGKPMLYLTRPEQTFNENGWKLVNSYYRAPGEDYYAIERFIIDVVLGNEDPMNEQRKRLFEEEYDYVSINGQKASEFIVNEVVDLIS